MFHKEFVTHCNVTTDMIMMMSLNQDYAFCFSLSLMTNYSRSHIGCRDSSQFSISALCKCGYPPNVSCNKFCDIAKIRSMAINRIPLGYVNNYDKNRYLEKISKAAVEII